MAKAKEEVNKSEEIRKVLAEDLKMPAADVIAALANNGIHVKAGLVYIVRGKMGAAKRKARKARVTSEMPLETSSADVIKIVHRVRELAGEVGGLKRLTALVDALMGQA